MPTVKRIVCLANSRKHSGRCIAGKEWTAAGPGHWVRPVSDSETGELSVLDYRYRSGAEPRLLDIVNVPVRAHQPKTYQSENWLIDATYWEPHGRIGWESLPALADHPPILWNTGDSTTTGLNDRIWVGEADKQRTSLYLLGLDALTVRVCLPPSPYRSQRRAQARFTYRDVHYAMWLTDRTAERVFLAKPEADYPIGPCYVTVSLGEPFHNYCYKLLAAVFTPRPLT